LLQASTLPSLQRLLLSLLKCRRLALALRCLQLLLP
jgi:hypothetical protein